MKYFSYIALAIAMIVPSQRQDTDIDNEQKAPIVIEGISRSNKPAELFPPIIYSLAPSSAGIVDAQNYFVPADGYVGQATVTVEAINRKNEAVTGQITFAVSNAPAIGILVTAGTPIDK